VNYGFQNYLYEPMYGNAYFDEAMAAFPKLQPDVPGRDLEPNLEYIFSGPGARYDFIRPGYDPKEHGVYDTYPRQFATDTHVKVHCVYFGGAAGFSFREGVDFLLGIFGLDFAGDDLNSRVAARKARESAEAAIAGE
jgi:hypothetical protein